MRTLALLAIRFYQRYLSPYKGFCCAYGAYTGHASCSALGYRAVRRFGVWHGTQVLDARLAKCGVTARRIARGTLQRQAGFCDLSCDLPDVDCCSSKSLNPCDIISDCLDVKDCCDWRKKKRQPQDDDITHVPPPRGRRRQRPPG